jgi:hypothetical protein
MAKATPTHGEKIKELKPGGSASLEKIDFGGALEVRKMPSGAIWLYWRYSADGRTERVTIGPYDPSRPPKELKPTARGYSIAAALAAARELAKKNAETPGGLRAESERQKAAAEAASKAAAARERYTLKALCSEYCDWLKKLEKSSHYDARNIFHNHLELAHPELVATPAAQVEKREIVAAIRTLQDAGKKTTARKLRAYLRAAYALALTADSDTELPEAFLHFKITENPVLAIKPIKAGRDKNPLLLAELRKYWKALQDEPGVIGAALRLHMLSGGQRIAQLSRLHQRDLAQHTMQLLDPKGKRDEPRVHLIPITKPMLDELAKLSKKGYILSTDEGTTPMHPTSLTAWAGAVAERAKIKDFQLKRVRSAIETELAALGIPLHIRGQLQSHGISGVQATSYDAHEYLPEKRAALEALHRLLERKDAKNVTPIHSRKKRA